MQLPVLIATIALSSALARAEPVSQKIAGVEKSAMTAMNDVLAKDAPEPTCVKLGAALMGNFTLTQLDPSARVTVNEKPAHLGRAAMAIQDLIQQHCK